MMIHSEKALFSAQEILDVKKIRQDFPILKRKVHGKPLIYLDNAATTQKPQCVIDTLNQYYSHENANIHRGIHHLSEKATLAYEGVRSKLKYFLNAPQVEEIIFVRGATEGINLVAQSYGRTFLKRNDEILISHMEHHSNIVPWQILCHEIGAELKVIPMNQSGELMMDAYEHMLSKKVKFLAVTHLSNALGSINPIQKMITMAHKYAIPVLIDGAQAVPHLKVDVQALDCDFYVFSAHKVYGPTGLGVLYGKRSWLEKMPPYQGGGDMISKVTFEETLYNALPYKFEAGTPHIAGVMGLGAALDYMNRIDLRKIAEYEKMLLDHASHLFSEIPGLRIIGTSNEKMSILSFVFAEVHAHDVGTILDQEGIAIRAGHHCAMPVMDFFNVPATARVSFAFYNTPEEIETLAAALRKVKGIFI
ncbi:MAG: cysteine desulfurase [Chlamydiae bacterium]|nr:cysteine desulfurase [Chlamydiota bacterium]MBI3276268.1 cysteine desulfurase [Chlamydiota bacterium]